MSYDYLHYLTDEQFIEKVCQIVPQQFHKRLEEYINRPTEEEREELEGFKYEVGDLEVQNDLLKDELRDVNNRIEGLENDINDLTEKISELEAELSKAESIDEDFILRDIKADNKMLEEEITELKSKLLEAESRV